jgi:hypothetical protein
MTDWVTISALATAAGTTVLAAATFAAVRSGNRSARAAERSLLAGLRPLLIASRPQDASQKIGFADSHWAHAPGGGGTAEATDEAVYLTMSVRNVGPGVAVLHGWVVHTERPSSDMPRPDVADVRRLTRDIYVPAGDVGFWQGALRDKEDEEFDRVSACIRDRKALTIDVMYGDAEGGQRVISRFTLTPGTDIWLASPSRHWNVDRPDPR